MVFYFVLKPCATFEHISFKTFHRRIFTNSVDTPTWYYCELECPSNKRPAVVPIEWTESERFACQHKYTEPKWSPKSHVYNECKHITAQSNTTTPSNTSTTGANQRRRSMGPTSTDCFDEECQLGTGSWAKQYGDRSRVDGFGHELSGVSWVFMGCEFRYLTYATQKSVFDVYHTLG